MCWFGWYCGGRNRDVAIFGETIINVELAIAAHRCGPWSLEGIGDVGVMNAAFRDFSAGGGEGERGQRRRNAHGEKGSQKFHNILGVEAIDSLIVPQARPLFAYQFER
jgi:hypothetical protein